MGKKVLGHPKILEKLVNFDRSSITRHTTSKLESLVQNPEFHPEAAEHASVAAKGMCLWVRALVQFNYVQREVRPKEKALAQAQKECRQLHRELKLKKVQLRTVQDALQTLLRQQAQKATERATTLATIRVNKQKIERAENLTGGLGTEMRRWVVSVRTLGINLTNLVGDVLLGAAFTSFLGPFPRHSREHCQESWQTIIAQQGVSSGGSFDFLHMYGDQVTFSDWVNNELPNDEYSKENALIMQHSLKSPICIDPQSQAYCWLRNSHPKLVVTRLADHKFTSLVENALQFGLPLLVLSLIHI